jgi:hypothetical protein
MAVVMAAVAVALAAIAAARVFMAIVMAAMAVVPVPRRGRPDRRDKDDRAAHRPRPGRAHRHHRAR